MPSLPDCAFSAATPPVLNCPCTVTTDFVFTADAVCNGIVAEAAIVVGSDGVNVNLAGFTLSGDDSNGIEIGAFTGGSVSNGEISGFEFGIIAEEATNYAFRGLRISGFRDGGVILDKGFNFLFEDNEFDTTVGGATGTGGGTCIAASEILGLEVINNDFTLRGAEAIGVEAEGSEGFTIIGNKFSIPGLAPGVSPADFNIGIQLINVDGVEIDDNCFFGPTDPAAGATAALDNTFGIKVEGDDDGLGGIDLSLAVTISSNTFNTLEKAIFLTGTGDSSTEDNCLAYNKVAIEVGEDTESITFRNDNFFNNDVDISFGVDNNYRSPPVPDPTPAPVPAPVSAPVPAPVVAPASKKGKKDKEDKKDKKDKKGKKTKSPAPSASPSASPSLPPVPFAGFCPCRLFDLSAAPSMMPSMNPSVSKNPSTSPSASPTKAKKGKKDKKDKKDKKGKKKL